MTMTIDEMLTAGTASLYKYLREFLVERYGSVQEDGDNYLFASGSRCLLNAHIDTMVSGPVQVMKDDGTIWNARGILGADDRAGIFAICEILRRAADEGIEVPSVLFTNYEERSDCEKGVFVFLRDVEMPSGITFIIGLDRKGGKEYVHYNGLLPEQVRTFVESFGYVEGRGSYSDVRELTAAWGVPSVNLSIGYHRPHSTDEFLELDEMQSTIDRVIAMLRALPQDFA